MVISTRTQLINFSISRVSIIVQCQNLEAIHFGVQKQKSFEPKILLKIYDDVVIVRAPV